MDQLLIQELALFSNIGVYEHEKTQPQPLLLSLEISLNLEKAIASDQLQDTVDYATLSEQLLHISLAKHYDLIEHLAGALLSCIFTFDLRIESVHLELHKPQALSGAKSAAVRLTRTRL